MTAPSDPKRIEPWEEAWGGYARWSEPSRSPFEKAAFRAGFEAGAERERAACAEIAETCYRQAKIDEKNGYTIERGDTSSCWIMNRIRSRSKPAAREGEDG